MCSTYAKRYGTIHLSIQIIVKYEILSYRSGCKTYMSFSVLLLLHPSDEIQWEGKKAVVADFGTWLFTRRWYSKAFRNNSFESIMLIAWKKKRSFRDTWKEYDRNMVGEVMVEGWVYSCDDWCCFLLDRWKASFFRPVCDFGTWPW